jgi:hypothetical protein
MVGIQNSSDPVVIAGAGPAGLSAALTIVRAGGRAIVYERRPDVGGRFHGDFQGIENWTTPQDALEELAAIGIEPTFEASPYREGAFYDPKGREYHYKSRDPLFYLVRRGAEPGTLECEPLLLRTTRRAWLLPADAWLGPGRRRARVVAGSLRSDLVEAALVSNSAASR